MSEPKPFASLSSGLLARKGMARPAMRPQGGFGGGIEDLGWNDMGHAPPVPPTQTPREAELPQHVPSSIAALTPAPKHGEAAKALSEQAPAEPPVVEQQRAIAASFPPEEEEKIEELPEIDESEPAPPIAAIPAAPAVHPSRARQAPGAKGKAAFTLRLDAERHLKLRLACAVTHRSAQQIVSGALDNYLKSLPELDALAGQLPGKKGNGS